MTAHLHRLPAGPVDLTVIPTDDTPGFDGGKKQGAPALAALGDELSDLQERLWAERGTGSRRRVLLVLQGMDTSGKGGTLRHTVGLMDPQGVKITSFKAPSDQERRHHFLWRIRHALPEPGYIGVFDRSHYEDVLIVRVHGLAEPETVERRYDEINAFEAELAADGVVLVKCMLHVSAAEQKERLLARLEDPEKYWKFNPGDIDERERWGEYRTTYQIALERTNTEIAPWYVVPSDRKWYRNLVIGRLLLDHLRALNPQWPPADFDVDAQRQRLLEETPVS
ncbi:MAG TPA: PPK2 family polyphosphate kinase [Nocardioides sp.]|uniref:PPK2 family polyphosphate kinase n=1 Tax=Nocardioides sp. TaxID=35761 RepID=UPI002E37EBD6|nr:PPK2 family polyphosphate kinase [Nocardioides sp.]HEX3931197.1 PPK2 family polyphosphate kinase [Nocardioides sp.]